MNLGLGLAAANAYFKEDDARVLREQQRQRFDWDKQAAEAELSTLADKTAANRSGYQLRNAQNLSDSTNLPDKAASERSGYRLRDAQNQANSKLLPSQTDNAKTRLTLDAADLKAQGDRQGAENATKLIGANMGLSNAQNDQANLPTKQAIGNNTLQGQMMTSKAELAQLPDKIRLAAVQGKLDQRGQGEVVLGTLGQLIAGQDKAGAIDFANKIAQVSDILPNTNGKTFIDIQPVRGGPQGDGYTFKTAEGDARFVPVQAIQAAMGKLKSGEYQFIHDNNGNVYAGNKATGQVTQTNKGDPAAARSRTNTPAEIQTAEWLVSKGIAKTDSQAWEMVRSSKEKTRSSFIMDYVSKNALPGQDTNKMANDAGVIYDQLRQAQGASNNPAQGTLDPRINSLIGVPSQ